MSAVTRAAIEGVLRQYTDPYLNQDPVSAGCVRAIDIQGGQVSVQLQLGYAAGLFKNGWAQVLQTAIGNLEGVSGAQVSIDCVVAAHKAQAQVPAMANVKNIIAVASGKGGVGKSTTAANLAVALKLEGLRVGILDADVYGPSQPRMLGVSGRPASAGGDMVSPLENYGVKLMSMGLLVPDDTAMIWRGPMVQSALTQMLDNVAWGELDVIIVDLPPGTGDIQISLAQQVNLTGAVIVSTPQDIALLDVVKALTMFEKAEVPILGMIQNMAMWKCPDCGREDHIFGEGGVAT